VSLNEILGFCILAAAIVLVVVTIGIIGLLIPERRRRNKRDD
jgi:ABC-type Fe3+-siderophore transport system permease subunit